MDWLRFLPGDPDYDGIMGMKEMTTVGPKLSRLLGDPNYRGSDYLFTYLVHGAESLRN